MINFDNRKKNHKLIYLILCLICIISLSAIIKPIVVRKIKEIAHDEAKGAYRNLFLARRDSSINLRLIAILNTEKEKLRRGIKNGIFYDFPSNNYFFQRMDNKADISYRIIDVRGYGAIKVELTKLRNNVIIYESNKFKDTIKDVPSGIYKLSAQVENHNIHIKVGVGDVYLVAGQSNAVSPAQKHPPKYSTTGLVAVNDLYRFPPLDKTSFVVPSKESPITSNICWLYCGDLLVEKLGIPVAFINIARGATNTKKWNPKYDFLSRGFKEILNNRVVKAVLWHQGESDFMEGIPEMQSFENMKLMINYTRKLQPDLDWFVALTSMKTELEESQIPIRKAQKAIIKEGLAFQGPDTDALRKNPEWIEESGAEFVGDGLKKHGMFWFEVLSKHYQ